MTPSRRLRRRAAAVALVLVAAYGLFGFLVLPRLVEREIPQLVEGQFGLHLKLGNVSVNPVLFRIDAHNVALAQVDRAELISARRVRIDFDLAGLLLRRWTIAALELDGPRVQLERRDDGTIELPDGLAREDRDPPAAEGPPPALLVRALRVRDGTLELADQAVPSRPIVLGGIALAAETLGSAPNSPPGRYSLSVRLPGGGALNAEGEIAIATRASTGRFRVIGATPRPFWPLLGRNLAIAPPEGTVSFEALYRAGSAAGASRLVLEALKLRADAIVLARSTAEAPLAALGHVEVAGGGLDLAARRLVLQGVRLADGRIGATVDADGRLDWAGVLRDRAGSDGQTPWRVELRGLELKNVGVHYRALAGAGRSFHAERADVQGDVGIDGNAGVRIAALAGTLADVAYVAGDASPLRAARVRIGDGRLDSAKREIAAGRIELGGGAVALAVGPDGDLVLPGGSGAPGPPTADQEGPSPWTVALGEIVAEGIELGFEDHRRDFPVSLRGTGDARVAALSTGSTEPFRFEARLRLESGGELSVEGEATADGRTANARLQLGAVELAPAAPLLARHTRLRLGAGVLSGELRFGRSGTEGGTLSAEGSIQVAGLRLDEADGDAGLLSAGRLSADGKLILPHSLRLTRIVADRPQGRLAIDQDRRLNVANLLRREPPRESPGETRGTAAEPAFAFRIDRIDLRNGGLDFADFSLVLPFSTRVEAVSGQILGIDNRPRSEAVIDVRGRVPPHGEAHAQGRIRAFAPAELTDLAVRFDNIEMPQLSPYTATFAGRTVAAGRLWLDVAYRVFDRQLDGNNGVTLENFVLGERVEAPEARDLPLELALALLKDPEGRAHIEIPVRGDLDDARFQYGRVVADAFGNVIQRIVTAPFRLLAGLVERRENDLDAIAFEPGSPRLSSAEEEKLQQLARALSQRPQLVVSLRGGYLADRDEAAIRERMTRAEIATDAGLPAQDSEAGLLDFGDAAVRTALARRYESEFGAEALAAFRRDFTRSDADAGETALHRALFDRLARERALPAAALTELAQRRAFAVREYLSRQGVPVERIRIRDEGEIERGEPRVELAVEAMRTGGASK